MIMNQSTTTILKKLVNLEQQVQNLKVQAYFSLSKKQRANALYPQESINKALRATRELVWQEKYAKKIKGLS